MSSMSKTGPTSPMGSSWPRKPDHCWLSGHSWARVGSLPVCGAVAPSCLPLSVASVVAAALTATSCSPTVNVRFITHSRMHAPLPCRLQMFLSIGWILKRMKENREPHAYGWLIASVVSRGGYYHVV